MLKFQLDTLDGVDDSVKGLYVETDGKFNLNVEGAPKDLSDNVTRLEKALESERTNSKGLSGQIDAQKLKTAEGSGDIEAMKKQMVEMHQTELAERDATIGSTKAQLRPLTIDNVITSAVSKAGGIADVLKPFIAGKTRLSESGQVEILNDKGEVRFDKSGDNLTIDAYVSSLKEDSTFAGVFKGTSHSGGGTTPSDGGVGASEAKTSLQKIASGLAKMK